VRYHALTDAQLNTAVAAGRTGPGPIGLYVACVGYQAAGVPGWIAGVLATMTPAFIIIVLLRFIGRRAEHPRVRRVIRAMLIAAPGCLLATAVGLAGSAIHDPFAASVAAAAFVLFALTNVDSLWVMLGAAAAGAMRWFLG